MGGRYLNFQMAVCFFALPAIFLACDRLKWDDGRKVKIQTEGMTYVQLCDTVRLLADRGRAFCDSLMKTATDSDTYYGYYIQKGRSYMYANKTDSVMPYIKATRAYASRRPSSPHVMTLLGLSNSLEASLYHLYHAKSKESVRLNTLAFNQIMKSDISEYAPDIAANLADSYIFIEDIPTAARWYRKALFLVDSLGLPQERNTTLYMGLGQIYTTLEDYDSAQKMYQRTDENYHSMRPNMQTYFLINYGNYYYYKGDYANALRIFKRLEKHLDKLGEKQGMDAQVCHVNLADVYLNLGKLDSAQTYLEAPARFFKKNKIDIGIHYTNTIQIGIDLERKDYAAVESILKNEGKLEVLDQNMKNIRAKYLTRYYAATGNYKKAFETATANQHQKDSTEHDRTRMRASEIMARFNEDTLKLHYQLELNKRQAEVQRSRASFWTSIGIVAVLLSVIVSGAFIIRKRKVQTDMNIFMLRLAAIRQRISPHFMFNVLNAKIGTAQKEEADTLVGMAELIRQNLDICNRQYVPLSEELTFVNNYVRLQRTLLGEDMECVMDVPDEKTLMTINIPSMFVQILVENAIKHGLKCIDGPKKLRIEVNRGQDGKTTINVIDNGPGFDITRQSAKSTRTGLDVISRTMAVLNKRNSRKTRMRFSIHNVENDDGSIAGCQATLTIPMRMKYV